MFALPAYDVELIQHQFPVVVDEGVVLTFLPLLVPLEIGDF